MADSTGWRAHHARSRAPLACRLLFAALGGRARVSAAATSYVPSVLQALT